MVDLLVLTSLDPFHIKNIIHISYKTSYLDEEVNCAEPSPHLVFPASYILPSSLTKVDIDATGKPFQPNLLFVGKSEREQLKYSPLG
jgi:hypothetical protein